MKTLKLIIGLAALLAFAGCSVKIRGQWDADLPGHFFAENHLEAGDLYLIRNGTPETVYVMLLDDRTPLDYFPLLPGASQRFTSPGASFDLSGVSERTLNRMSLWWIPN